MACGMRSPLSGVLLTAVLSTGCDGQNGSPASPTTAVSVRFDYRAPTRTDPALAAAAPACVQGVGQTHIHPSWRDFRRVDMMAEGAELWTITFSDVPPNARHRIRVSDPNACAQSATGAVTELRVFANGVLLTERVDTPGSGTEPGFAFSVDSQGRVTP